MATINAFLLPEGGTAILKRTSFFAFFSVLKLSDGGRQVTQWPPPQIMSKPFRNRCKPEKFVFARKMRNNPTPSEALLGAALKKRAFRGLRWRAQSVIFGWIVDFYCPFERLVVEIDGCYHDAVEDARRDKILKDELMLDTLRFKTGHVIRDLPGVLRQIGEHIDKRRRNMGL